MSNLVCFRVNSTFPLSHVRVASTNELRRNESLIILQFHRIAKPDEERNSRYLWRYKVVCKWSRDRLIGSTLCIVTYPLAPTVHPVCGVYVTPDMLKRKSIPFGTEDNDWCRVTKRQLVDLQRVSFSNASRMEASRQIPKGKDCRAALINHIFDYQRCPVLSSTDPVWIGSFYGVPLWALLYTECIFGAGERNVLKYYEIFADHVMPTPDGNGDVRRLLAKSARHVCFPSRTVSVRSRKDESGRCGDLFFFQLNGTLVADCDMVKVLYSYHCAKWLRRFQWGEYDKLFKTYKECVLEVFDRCTEKMRLAFGWVCKSFLKQCLQCNELVPDGSTTNNEASPLFCLQFVDDDLLMEDEEPVKCTPSTSVQLGECQTRIPFGLWKDRYRVARALFQTEGDVQDEEEEPCIVEFAPMLECAAYGRRKTRTSIKLWKPPTRTLLDLKRPVQVALAECRALNVRSVQMKPPRILHKRRQRVQEGGCLVETVAFGATSAVGPNIETLFKSSDQILEVKYFDVWGQRDFFTVCIVRAKA